MWNKFYNWFYDILALRTYYVTFIWVNKEGNTLHSWRIVDTYHNLETSNGLKNFIAEIENEDVLSDILITFYKRLK